MNSQRRKAASSPSNRPSAAAVRCGALRGLRRRVDPINLAVGAREAAIAKSEGEKQAEINQAQGEATATLLKAEATAKAIRQIGESISVYSRS